MGCLQKVFEAEIDVEMLAAAERSREGFGAVRALRRAAADVTCGGAVDVLAARERARLRQSGVRRAAGRLADVRVFRRVADF
jgi:hypothetical protein